MRRSLTGALLLLLAACSSDDGVEQRFYDCRDLVADKTARQASLDCWTTDSRPMIDGLLEQRRVTGRVLDYLEGYSKLLDYDEIVAAPRVVGDLALLTVARGRHREVVVMVREEDAWRIDPLELSEFWRPLDEKAVLR